MSEVFGENAFPIQCPVDAGTYYEGEILKVSSTAGRAQKITAKADEAIAVVDEPSVDSRGDAVALVAGTRIAVWRLGSGKTVMMKSVTGAAYTPHAPVYLDDAVDGQVTASAATSRPVGHFPAFGYNSRTTAAAGELIPVTLDVQIGATPV